MSATRALYGRDGYFSNDAYKNLEAVAIFWEVNDDREVWYRMKVYLNPHATDAVRLPDDFRMAFNARELS